jgi:hypothetical protein
MGKSEFLEQDLKPAAREAQYLTVYLDLWDARKPAGAGAPVRAHSGKPTGFGRLARSLKRPLKNFKASAKLAGIAEGSLEAELGRSRSRNRPGNLHRHLRLKWSAKHCETGCLQAPHAGLERPGHRQLEAI